MEIANQIIDIIQGLVIICATIFTSWWAYKTFAHKEKINELKDILNVIEDIHFEISIYKIVGNFRDHVSNDQFVDLVSKLYRLIFSSLYLNKKDRANLQKIVASIVESYKLLSFEKNKTEWEKAFSLFEQNYNEILEKIHKISKKYI